jgi:hypothetical protein
MDWQRKDLLTSILSLCRWRTSSSSSSTLLYSLYDFCNSFGWNFGSWSQWVYFGDQFWSEGSFNCVFEEVFIELAKYCRVQEFVELLVVMRILYNTMDKAIGSSVCRRHGSEIVIASVILQACYRVLVVWRHRFPQPCCMSPGRDLLVD